MIKGLWAKNRGHNQSRFSMQYWKVWTFFCICLDIVWSQFRSIYSNINPNIWSNYIYIHILSCLYKGKLHSHYFQKMKRAVFMTSFTLNCKKNGSIKLVEKYNKNPIEGSKMKKGKGSEINEIKRTTSGFSNSIKNHVSKIWSAVRKWLHWSSQRDLDFHLGFFIWWLQFNHNIIVKNINKVY